MSDELKAGVILKWRTQAGLNLRVVRKVPVYRDANQEYVMEWRTDNETDAMGVDRWLPTEPASHADELLRKLGEAVSK